MSGLPAKIKILLILVENSWKTEIKLFPLCAILWVIVDKLAKELMLKGFYQFILGSCSSGRFLKISTRGPHNIRTEVRNQVSSKSLPSPISDFHFILPLHNSCCDRKQMKITPNQKGKKYFWLCTRLNVKYVGADYPMAMKHMTLSTIRFLIDRPKTDQ